MNYQIKWGFLCWFMFSSLWDMYFGYIRSYLVPSREPEERCLIHIFQFTEIS